jgi:hypothetical protein
MQQILCSRTKLCPLTNTIQISYSGIHLRIQYFEALSARSLATPLSRPQPSSDPHISLRLSDVNYKFLSISVFKLPKPKHLHSWASVVLLVFCKSYILTHAVQIRRMDPESTTAIGEKRTEVLHVTVENKTEDIGLSNTASSRPSPKSVQYRVEYRHESTNKVIHSIQVDSSDSAAHLHGKSSIFDIVTVFKTNDEEFKPRVDSKNAGAQPNSTPYVSDTRKLVDMHIHSPAIIQALRSVVKYYPGQEILGESIIISYPYLILIHHEKARRIQGELQPRDPKASCVSQERGCISRYWNSSGLFGKNNFARSEKRKGTQCERL